MSRTIAQLTDEQLTWIDGYTKGDSQKFQAIMLGFFEKQSSRAVERTIGMPENTVRRVVADFAVAYADWVKRRVKMGEVVDDGEDAGSAGEDHPLTCVRG